MPFLWLLEATGVLISVADGHPTETGEDVPQAHASATTTHAHEHNHDNAQSIKTDHR
jgi:hypothetical protein